MDEPTETWVEVTTMHDTERVFLNVRSGERRTEPFPPMEPVVAAQVADLLRQIERESRSEKPADPAAGG